MKKVFALAPHEDWIVDRFVNEWNVDNHDISTTDIRLADIVWLMADWCWRAIPAWALARRKVITTIHHIVPQKFNLDAHREFMQRDMLTTIYHVPNKYTEEFIAKLTKKPIYVIPYWANQRIWTKTSSSQNELKERYDIPNNRYIVGSFQRDTEGADLISPKLEKGPDLLVDALISIKQREPSLHVILAGWRRQYVMNRLNNEDISFSYFEKPLQRVINDLYQTLDLYPITSRYEGGPQALIECGLLNVPVISRHVGIADIVLNADAINDDVINAKPCIPDVSSLLLPNGYKPYRELIEAL